MAIKFRTDKASPLTYSEMDNNFGSFFYSASISNTSVTLYYPSSSEVPVNSGSVSFSLVKGLQQTGGDRKIAFYSGSSELTVDDNFGIDTDGSVGIGVNVQGDFPLSHKLTVSGSIKATGTIIQGSDERTKENIEPIPFALDLVNKLQGVTYKLKDSDRRDAGVIAQQIQEVIPEVVYEDNNSYLGVNYNGIVPYLIEAVKELKQDNEALKSRLKILEDAR